MTGTAGYPMRQWVFEDSYGRYDIDLGDSHVECGRLDQLTLPTGLELGYGSDRGQIRLRTLIADLYAERSHSGDPESVLVTHGSQEALYLLYATLLRPGDRVITFAPGWPQSWVAPARLGADVEVLGLTGEMTVDVAAAQAAAGPDVRLVVVNSPGNPTGRRVPRADLERLLELVESFDGYLLLDEEYVLDLAGSLAAGPGRVVSVSSLSKVYGLPGLRLGWMYGPPAVIAACAEYKHLTTISNSVLTESLACDVLSRRDSYARGYDRLVAGGLEQLRDWVDRHPDQLRLACPEGTPFGWVSLLTGEESLSFCRRVLNQGVLVMPGETLGAGGGFRITFAREPALLAEGLRRIDAVLCDPVTGHSDGAN